MISTAHLDMDMQADLMADMMNQDICGRMGGFNAGLMRPGAADDDWMRQVTGMPPESFQVAPMDDDGGRDSFGALLPVPSKFTSKENVGQALDDALRGLLAEFPQLDEPAPQAIDFGAPANDARDDSIMLDFREKFCKPVDKTSVKSALLQVFQAMEAGPEADAANAEMRKCIFRGMDAGAQEAFLRDLGLTFASPPPSAASEPAGTSCNRWSWPEPPKDMETQERAGVKRALKSKLFGGIQRALDSGDLEEALHEIALDHHVIEAGAVRADYSAALWRGAERSLNNGALQTVFEDIDRKHACHERSAMKGSLGGSLFANLDRAVQDGSLERALAGLVLDEED